jgi:hypothetical protein
MQARLEIWRLPSRLVAIVLAVLMALVLGAALGYALRPATVVTGPAHVVYLPASQVDTSGRSDCIYTNKHKAC